MQLPVDVMKLATGRSHDAQVYQREMKLVEACRNSKSLPVFAYLEKIVALQRLLRPADRDRFFLWFFFLITGIEKECRLIKTKGGREGGWTKPLLKFKKINFHIKTCPYKIFS